MHVDELLRANWLKQSNVFQSVYWTESYKEILPQLEMKE